MKFKIAFFFLLIATISFSQQQRSETETWDLARKIHQQILNGNMSFQSAAVLYSEDPATTSKGGDIGWAKRGMFVPDYDAVAWKLPIGKISEPFKTEFGIMIVQVVDKNKEEVWTRYILLKLPEEKK